MDNKVLLQLSSGLMVLLLALAACAPAAVEEKILAPEREEKKSAPVIEEKKQAVTEREAVKPAVEPPKYGGTVTIALTGDIRDWTEFTGALNWASAPLTNQELLQGDWIKGAAGGYGTNEVEWEGAYAINRLDFKTGALAESFEMLEPGHWILKLRKGVHYSVNPKSWAEASRLAAGREFTAHDAASALMTTVTLSGSYFYLTYPELRMTFSAVALDKYTVEMKVPQESAMTAILQFFDLAHIDWPVEVIEKYKPTGLGDWRKSVGAGPFMLSDYVPGSVLRLDKNPNYWMKDPIGPGKGNQLPYLNGVNFLIIPDLSTRQAALRTGKLDRLSGISKDDAELMKKTTTQLKFLKYPGGNVGSAMSMRTDKVPFNDIRARRALMMATDFNSINKALLGGEGQILTWPLAKSRGYEDAYLSLDDPEMPASVKELYVYNPEKAKQLLKEAGYPNGLKASVLLTASDVDYMAIIKDMWSKVGIQLEFNLKESGTFTTLMRARNYDALITSANPGPVAVLYTLMGMRGEAFSNMSYINDPKVEEAHKKMQRLALTDLSAAHRVNKELMKYVLDQVWAIPSPRGVNYTFWWPWLRNYSGEEGIGYGNSGSWAQFVWTDQEMKKSMGY